MGLNISSVNPDHLPEDVLAGRTTKRGFKKNFIGCTMNETTKQSLLNKLKTQYGAIEVKNHDGIKFN
jgi:cytochrome oxidase Cu insertion factor (SCO1/SenC/PrrC family)